MREYILRRVIQLIPTLILISIVSFTIIQLPPGDYVTTYVANLAAAGEELSEEEIAALEEHYGLNQPGYIQYIKWITNFVQGDMGALLLLGSPGQPADRRTPDADHDHVLLHPPLRLRHGHPHRHLLRRSPV